MNGCCFKNRLFNENSVPATLKLDGFYSFKLTIRWTTSTGSQAAVGQLCRIKPGVNKITPAPRVRVNTLKHGRVFKSVLFNYNSYFHMH